MNPPSTMRYIDLPGFGGAEVMRLAEGPLPVPGDHDVLIAVEYAGVNRPDVVQRTGHYKAPPGASPILGLEVSGMIAAKESWPYLAIQSTSLRTASTRVSAQFLLTTSPA